MARDHSRRLSPVVRCLRALACVVLAALAVVVVANGVTVATTRGQVHTVPQLADELAEAPADAVVVLWASVYANGRPSDILADRLEVAVALSAVGDCFTPPPPPASTGAPEPKADPPPREVKTE